jgi:hypothetical protein
MGSVVYNFDDALDLTLSDINDIRVVSGNIELTSSEYENDLYTSLLMNLNEISGDASNLAGIDGTPIGVTRGITGPDVYGKAYRFDGVSSHVRVDSTATNMAFGHTLEVRCKPTKLAGVETLVAKRNTTMNTDTNFALQFVEGRLRFFYRNGTNRSFTDSVTSYALDEFVHIAVVIEESPNTLKFYKNGVEVYSASLTKELLQNSAAIEVGGNASGNGDYFQGDIDFVRMSNTVRPGFNTRPTLYATSNPTATLTSSFTDSEATSWAFFGLDQTENSLGLVGIQLSDDDGATFKYWDGANWTAGAFSNDPSTVDQFIRLFPVTPSGIKFRVILGSDGISPVFVDRLVIGYESDALFAGAPGSVKTGQAMAPFKDSDIDPTAVSAAVRISGPTGALVNGSAINTGAFTDVSVGAFSSISDAVKGARYLSDTTGQFTFELQVFLGTEEANDSVDVDVEAVVGTFEVLEPASIDPDAVNQDLVPSEDFEYEIRDEEGNTVESGVASSPLQVEFDIPGLYTIEITRQAAFHSQASFTVGTSDFDVVIFLSRLEQETAVIAPGLPPFDISIEGIDVSPSRRETTLGDAPRIDFIVFDRRTQVPINLTNYDVFFLGKEDIRDIGLGWERQCVVTNAKQGCCTVQMDASDFPNIGQFTATIEILNKDTGRRLTTKRYQHDVVRSLRGS